VGGLSRGELKNRLREKSIFTNKYAEMLLSDSSFTTSSAIARLNVITVSTEQMGLVKGGTTENVFSTALELGFHLCPVELAVHLRLQYYDEYEDSYLTVASKKLREANDYPAGFYLKRQNTNLWLRGYRASHDYEWSPESRFVFIVEC